MSLAFNAASIRVKLIFNGAKRLQAKAKTTALTFVATNPDVATVGRDDSFN